MTGRSRADILRDKINETQSKINELRKTLDRARDEADKALRPGGGFWDGFQKFFEGLGGGYTPGDGGRGAQQKFREKRYWEDEVIPNTQRKLKTLRETLEGLKSDLDHEERGPMEMTEPDWQPEPRYGPVRDAPKAASAAAGGGYPTDVIALSDETPAPQDDIGGLGLDPREGAALAAFWHEIDALEHRRAAGELGREPVSGALNEASGARGLGDEALDGAGVPTETIIAGRDMGDPSGDFARDFAGDFAGDLASEFQDMFAQDRADALFAEQNATQAAYQGFGNNARGRGWQNMDPMVREAVLRAFNDQRGVGSYGFDDLLRRTEGWLDKLDRGDDLPDADVFREMVQRMSGPAPRNLPQDRPEARPGEFEADFDPDRFDTDRFDADGFDADGPGVTPPPDWTRK